MDEKLGLKFIRFRTQPFEKSYEEMCAGTPVFFILSAGVDPLKVQILCVSHHSPFNLDSESTD